jgi:hypothetical protein
MAKELPILPSTAQPAEGVATEAVVYSRVFCKNENAPPLRLLVDFLKSRGQLPILPADMDDAMLDEWAWVQVTLSYARERKPIQVFCVRDRGTYKDVFEQEQKQFLETLSPYDDIEAGLAQEQVTRARFILTTRMIEADVSEEGYDFNGWILEFFQEHCNGIVQIDGQGFFSPKGELIVDLSVPEE